MSIPKIPTLSIGTGIRNIVYFLMFVATAATIFHYGKEQFKSEVQESNLEVISEDSKVGLKIAIETEETKVNLNEKLNNLKDPISTDGYISTEFMLIVRSEKSAAERRGNEGGIIRTVTEPWKEWVGED